ncbi:MAG: HPP family protein [Candidatus Accumulibacter sp.]|jgi:CBS-domain-containing membrane protein|nr:HPP family protein [Accumulibacter sp.]
MFAHPLIRLAWCLAGMACGIGFTLFLVGPDHAPLLLASLGGTSVFLFSLTRSPAAQPRALLGGHLGSAVVGVACYQALGESLAVYVLAMCLALALMLATRTIHPPAGANPILLIHAHADWAVLWYPVLSGLVSLMLVAIVWSRLYPGLAPYPTEPWAPSPQKLDWGGWGP